MFYKNKLAFQGLLENTENSTQTLEEEIHETAEVKTASVMSSRCIMMPF